MALRDELREAAGQIAEVNAGRAAFYRMLSSLYYREVTQEKIGELLGVDWSALFADEEMAEGSDGMVEGLRLMTGSLKRADGRTRQELASDYAHTFLAAGTYKEHMAVPYESVYTSEEHLLMQDARDEVYRFFCEEHLGTAKDDREPEDHLSFECEFMATMADRMTDALRADEWDEAARLVDVSVAFRDNHLANWIDDFCDAVAACAQTPFYRGLGQVTRAFVASDGESLTDIAASVHAMATAWAEQRLMSPLTRSR